MVSTEEEIDWHNQNDAPAPPPLIPLFGGIHAPPPVVFLN